VRLRSVEVIPYALPFRDPYVTARGVLREREMVLLRLRDDDGIVGLGEAVPLSLRGGASLTEVVRELDAFEAVPGLDDAGLIAGMPALSAPARCAAQTALADLRERRSGVEQDTSPIPCNATLVAGEPGAVAEEALRWGADGFSTFKLKLGVGDDVGQVRAVREALGPGARIRVDANAAWSLEQAERILNAIEPYDVELAEQPVETMEEAAALTERTAIPLAGDESIASVEDSERAAASGAFAWTGIKLSKVGGADEGAAIARKLPAYVASALDGPVGIAAGAQLARWVRMEGKERPRIAHGLATQRLFAATIAAVECELRDGTLYPPPGPGLGVEIDEDALAAHRL
jgi:o-succinylbenzoate synthase